MEIIYGDRPEDAEIDNLADVAERVGFTEQEIRRILKPENVFWNDDPLVFNLIENKDPRIISLAKEALTDSLARNKGDREMLPFIQKQKRDLEAGELDSADLWLLATQRLEAIHYALLDE